MNLRTLILLIITTSFFACEGESDNDMPNNEINQPELPKDNVLIIPETGYTTPLSYNGMNAVWADEFDNNELNEDYWTFQIGDGCPNICGWGNNEQEYYKKENTSFKDGFLIIEGKAENAGSRSYTSSRITTQGKFTFKYGRVDVRAVLPIY